MKEAETGEIRIVGFEVDSIQCMIDFLYLGDYDDGLKQTETTEIASTGMIIC